MARILVACEYSGVVRDAFSALGHDSWSCDLEPTDRPGNHYQDDIRNVIDYGWDLMIAHPPCTHLAVSGSRHFTEKRKDGRQQQGIDFFYANDKRPYSYDCCRKSNLYHVNYLSQTRPDHPALAIWTRRNKSNMPMVKRLANAITNKYR